MCCGRCGLQPPAEAAANLRAAVTCREHGFELPPYMRLPSLAATFAGTTSPLRCPPCLCLQNMSSVPSLQPKYNTSQLVRGGGRGCRRPSSRLLCFEAAMSLAAPRCRSRRPCRVLVAVVARTLANTPCFTFLRRYMPPSATAPCRVRECCGCLAGSGRSRRVISRIVEFRGAWRGVCLPVRARLLRRGVFANAGIVCSLDVCCASQRCLRVLS